MLLQAGIYGGAVGTGKLSVVCIQHHIDNLHWALGEARAGSSGPWGERLQCHRYPANLCASALITSCSMEYTYVTEIEVLALEV